QKPARLPSLGSEAHPRARLEACDACRRYVKSIDLTADARPIPEVDDLASIAMDLWAIGQGYERIEPGWAGI
ncbi:MAG TPA: formate dehydrogenase accessory protein FdhE, partial [Thermoanaerobaculia bacterium]|nr:formate dehydrogenase accessory protein FdhE [Thermoanaerobaculia bacterium]